MDDKQFTKSGTGCPPCRYTDCEEAGECMAWVMARSADAVREASGDGPDFNQEANLHADTIAERHDARSGDVDMVPAMAKILAEAWQKYVEGFGVPPHGTERQFMGLLELASAKERIAALFAVPSAGLIPQAGAGSGTPANSACPEQPAGLAHSSTEEEWPAPNEHHEAGARLLEELRPRVASSRADGFKQIGWARLEQRMHAMAGVPYDVIGSVSDEKTEHHPEPIYIRSAPSATEHDAVLEKAARACEARNHDRQGYVSRKREEARACAADIRALKKGSVTPPEERRNVCAKCGDDISMRLRCDTLGCPLHEQQR
jgi:hypothetical protein